MRVSIIISPDFIEAWQSLHTMADSDCEIATGTKRNLAMEWCGKWNRVASPCKRSDSHCEDCKDVAI
jgi:hypothetical protein